MKSFLFVLGLIFSTAAFSQEATTASVTTSSATIEAANAEPMVAKGIRFSLVKPFFEMSENLKLRETTVSTEVDYEAAGGLALGYVHLPEDEFGYTAQVALYEAKIKNVKERISFARASVNAAYSAATGVSLLAGLNTMKFRSNSNLDLESLNMQIGWQAGLNFQFNESFSAAVQYYELNTSGLVDAGASLSGYNKISREIVSRGTELEVAVTF